ncbi:MAG: LytR/AlgR family response regulator transcription factor [bacterium]
MLRAIIIDDEEKGRKLLRNLLAQYCKNVEVVFMADSVTSGAEGIQKYDPEIVFLDIVMPNEDGFELLSKVPHLRCEIIFTTAYNEYAIRAIRVCALDYLLKPIDVEELQGAVARAEGKIATPANGQGIDRRLEALVELTKGESKKPGKIGFPTSNGITFHNIDDICVCKAEGNYTTVYFGTIAKLELVSKTLKEFEELLSDYNFIRTHRSYLVNLNHLKAYKRVHPSRAADGEGGCVVVANNMRVPVSRDKRKALLERIQRPF